jgi:hypothetical protein
MRKTLNPEISLGFLAATVLWIGVLGWQASYAPTEIERQKCYAAAHEAGHKSEECKTFWERTTTDPVAFFTLVLAISTVGLWGATIFLYRAGERQIKVAEIGAKAADRSARAVIALQLPIIRIHPDKLGYGDTLAGGLKFEECSVSSVNISNLGPTKAFPLEILYGFTVGNELPSEPSYRYLDRFLTNVIFEPNLQVPTGKNLTMALPLKPGQRADIMKGNYLWFYCALRYEDFMGEIHSHGFCWRWAYVGSGLDWRGDDTPAYNRKT